MGAKKDDEGDEMMDEEQAKRDPVERLFGIELESTFKNSESETEEKKVTMENVLKLPCHIDNNNNPINSLQEGLDISLTSTLEKYSDTLGRNANYVETKKVNKLPSYLCIQFVRFYWKKQSNVGGTEAGKAKILRSVMYPKVFDLYNFCSDELKKSLDHGREFEQKIREEEDRERLEGKKKEAEESDAMLRGEVKAMTEEEKEKKKLVGKALKQKEAEEEQKRHDEQLYRPHG